MKKKYIPKGEQALREVQKEKEEEEHREEKSEKVEVEKEKVEPTSQLSTPSSQVFKEPVATVIMVEKEDQKRGEAVMSALTNIAQLLAQEIEKVARTLAVKNVEKALNALKEVEENVKKSIDALKSTVSTLENCLKTLERYKAELEKEKL